MKLVLATSNKGKVREIKAMCRAYEVVPYSELIEPFEIIEDGTTFKANALIKAQAVYRALNDLDALVIADDSGISVDALGGAPGIYSARYGGVGASDRDNLLKVVAELQARGLRSSKAHYTAAIAIMGAMGSFCVHGWMHGEVIDTPRGEGGFGYDPIFIPQGYKQTLGELDEEIKKTISHRAQALELARLILRTLA
ncbi:MAG: RdgB/HAM1 family non-canonical purine NTP pyrophosphatase [Campylobacterales bacterium]|nr:RdgB/HAM1 family non-canonical purine NTP pyrophosphatase [Campylobacterales bacterium]